jgi:hypothetical protein
MSIGSFIGADYRNNCEKALHVMHPTTIAFFLGVMVGLAIGLVIFGAVMLVPVA